MTAQAEQYGVPGENPPSTTMDRRLRDFTRVNPPVYTGCNISKDLEDECRAFMLHDSMDLSRIMIHVLQVEESRKG